MGNNFANLFKKPEFPIAMVGLTKSGQTSILHYLKDGKALDYVMFTMGFNLEIITHQNLHFKIFDVGGSDKIYPLWRHYFGGSRTVIFVIDSCNREEMEQVHSEFWRIFSYEDYDFKEVLIYATKQDLLNAMTAQEITEKLELHTRSLPRNINWYVQECSGKTGSGLFDGLSWIVRQISSRPTA